MLRVVVNHALYPNGEPHGWIRAPDDLASLQALDPSVTVSIYLPDYQAWQLAQLAALRYEKETAGITWTDAANNTYNVATNRPSLAAIAANFSASKNGVRASPALWKMADGSFVALTNAQMNALAAAIIGYVQACFENEAALAAAINAAADEAALLAIDITAGWPSTGLT